MTFSPYDLSYPQTRIIYTVEIIRALKPFCIPVIAWDQGSMTLSFNGVMIQRNDNNTYDVFHEFDMSGSSGDQPDMDIVSLDSGIPLNAAIQRAIVAYYDTMRDAQTESIDLTGQILEDHPERVYYDALNFLQSSGIDVSIGGKQKDEGQK